MSPPTALNILIVHGIGWGERGSSYARPLIDGIRREFDAALRRLRLRDVDSGAAQAKRALRFEAACWAPVTQQPEDALLRLMFGWTGLLRRFNPTFLIRRNMVGLLGDVIGYERDPQNAVYRAIHDVLEACVARLSAASADERGDDGLAPLTVIGHSLGSVIASDYLWDHTHRASDAHHLDEHNLVLVNLVLMGSPMALYALRNNAYGGRDDIRQSLSAPVQVDPDHGLWLNLYDRQDAIAFPLEPIAAYRAAGVVDRPVSAGNWLTRWNLGSHTGYWRSEDTARLIGHKLALDWARLNSPRFAERDYERALANFRKTLRRH